MCVSALDKSYEDAPTASPILPISPQNVSFSPDHSSSLPDVFGTADSAPFVASTSKGDEEKAQDEMDCSEQGTENKTGQSEKKQTGDGGNTVSDSEKTETVDSKETKVLDASTEKVISKAPDLELDAMVCVLDDSAEKNTINEPAVVKSYKMLHDTESKQASTEMEVCVLDDSAESKGTEERRADKVLRDKAEMDICVLDDSSDEEHRSVDARKEKAISNTSDVESDASKKLRQIVEAAAQKSLQVKTDYLRLKEKSKSKDKERAMQSIIQNALIRLPQKRKATAMDEGTASKIARGIDEDIQVVHMLSDSDEDMTSGDSQEKATVSQEKVDSTEKSSPHQNTTSEDAKTVLKSFDLVNAKPQNENSVPSESKKSVGSLPGHGLGAVKLKLGTAVLGTITSVPKPSTVASTLSTVVESSTTSGSSTCADNPSTAVGHSTTIAVSSTVASKAVKTTIPEKAIPDSTTTIEPNSLSSIQTTVPNRTAQKDSDASSSNSASQKVEPVKGNDRTKIVDKPQTDEAGTITFKQLLSNLATKNVDKPKTDKSGAVTLVPTKGIRAVFSNPVIPDTKHSKLGEIHTQNKPQVIESQKNLGCRLKSSVEFSASKESLSTVKVSRVNSPSVDSHKNPKTVPKVDAESVSSKEVSALRVNSPTVSRVHSPTVSRVHSPTVSRVNSPTVSSVSSPIVSHVHSPTVDKPPQVAISQIAKDNIVNKVIPQKVVCSQPSKALPTQSSQSNKSGVSFLVAQPSTSGTSVSITQPKKSGTSFSIAQAVKSGTSLSVAQPGQSSAAASVSQACRSTSSTVSQPSKGVMSGPILQPIRPGVPLSGPRPSPSTSSVISEASKSVTSRSVQPIKTSIQPPVSHASRNITSDRVGQPTKKSIKSPVSPASRSGVKIVSAEKLGSSSSNKVVLGLNGKSKCASEPLSTHVIEDIEDDDIEVLSSQESPIKKPYQCRSGLRLNLSEQFKDNVRKITNGKLKRPKLSSNVSTKERVVSISDEEEESSPKRPRKNSVILLD